MREMDATKRGILRISCDQKCFLPYQPYDKYCDSSVTGTGFLVTFNGYPHILTNHHVIQNAVRVTCTSPSISDGEGRPLSILGYNPFLDIAVLEGTKDVMELVPYTPSPSSTLAPGDSVRCVGFAAGTLRTHTTTGSVSGRSDYPHNRIQTDAGVNPGNSGGPVLSADTGRVVGIVTSGMDDMQVTNFFSPMDEVYLCVRRIMSSREERGGKGPVVDMGFFFPAIVKPVNSSACMGEQGGSMVVACKPGTGLETGDVLLGVQNQLGELLGVNSFMRVQDDSVWKHDTVDFRTLSDTLPLLQSTSTWKVRVRRRDKMVDVNVVVGPPVMGMKELFPDCEGVRYASYGGLIFMNASVDHYRYNECPNEPDSLLNSFPIVCTALMGSPFTSHTRSMLRGKKVMRMIGDRGEERETKCLDDVIRCIRTMTPLVIHLEDGTLVGATREEIEAFDSKQGDPSLKRGEHFTRLGNLQESTH